jgi:hypothetical protein
LPFYSFKLLLSPSIALPSLFPPPHAVWTALGVAVFVFWLAGKCGGRQIIGYLSRTYGGGYSAVNWPNPGIFGPSSKLAIEEAKVYLTGESAFSFPLFNFASSPSTLLSSGR